MPAKQTATPETNVSAQATAQPVGGQSPNVLAIGRIVHFVMPDLTQRPAIVTWVYGTDGHGGDLDITGGQLGADRNVCDVVVFTNAEEHGAYGAAWGIGKTEYDASGQQPQTWHWPSDTTVVSGDVSSATPQAQTGGASSSSSGSGGGSDA